MSAISILEFDGAGSCCKGEELVPETYSHDWDLRGLHKLAEVVDGLLAMCWISRTIGTETR